MKTPYEDSHDRAEQIVKEALGVLMKAAEGQDCPRRRAEDGVRRIAGILCDLSHEHQLHANLKAELWDISDGSEPVFPRRSAGSGIPLVTVTFPTRRSRPCTH